MNVWKVFLAGIVAGTIVLLLLLGAGYQWAGTPGVLRRLPTAWSACTEPGR